MMHYYLTGNVLTHPATVELQQHSLTWEVGKYNEATSRTRKQLPDATNCITMVWWRLYVPFKTYISGPVYFISHKWALSWSAAATAVAPQAFHMFTCQQKPIENPIISEPVQQMWSHLPQSIKFLPFCVAV